MTKVYVVLGTERKYYCTWVSAVFTNKRKAENYRNWMATMHTEIKYKIDEQTIDTFDYSKMR